MEKNIKRENPSISKVTEFAPGVLVDKERDVGGNGWVTHRLSKPSTPPLNGSDTVHSPKSCKPRNSREYTQVCQKPTRTRLSPLIQIIEEYITEVFKVRET